MSGLGRSPGEGNGNPLQESCLENPVDGGTWWATVYGVAKSQTQLSMHACTSLYRQVLHWQVNQLQIENIGGGGGEFQKVSESKT